MDDHSKNFLPLASTSRLSPYADKAITRTTITTKRGLYMGSDNNSSKEMIITSNSGIQKQVGFWVKNEDRNLVAANSDAGRSDTGKSDLRSPSMVDETMVHGL